MDADFADEYPDADRASTELYASLMRTGSALSTELDRVMLTSIGEAQILLNSLAVIEGAGEPLTPGQVGERTLVSSATITSTLDRLEYKGWVRRVPNPDDRRSVLLEITDAGQAVADRFLPGIHAVERAALAELTDSERATLMRLLGKVLRGVATVAAAEPIPLEGRRVRPARLP